MDRPSTDRRLEDDPAVEYSELEGLRPNDILVDLKLIDLEIELLPKELVGAYFMG